MSANNKAPLVYLIACEPSGDQLGALLMQALKQETGGAVRFAGIGGPQMAGEGLATLFDGGELALLGIFEVLPKAPLVLRRVRQTLEDISRRDPAVLVTIDSWGFTGRIHQRLARARSEIPRLRYVAPQVWAWRPGRARQLAQWIHHLLALLPFEPPYFTRYGLPTTWVGHPVLECGADRGMAERFRKRYSIRPDKVVLCVLPGSRRGEVKRLEPVFKDCVALLAETIPGLHVVMPTVATVEAQVVAATASWPVPVTVVTSPQDRYDAFAASRAALAASGTVSLELAVAGVPHLIAYRVNALSAWAFRKLATTRQVNLVNILLNAVVVPEHLQEDCTADRLAEDMRRLLGDETVRTWQQDQFKAALDKLRPPGTTPSRAAAQMVLSIADQGSREARFRRPASAPS